MVKIMMKIGNHFNSNNRSRYSVPNNQVMFGLNGNRKVGILILEDDFRKQFL